MQIIKLNDRGAEVKKLQLLLNSSAFPQPNLSIDGHFGHHTKQAVMAFQRAEGLTPDGIVGANTRIALGLKLAPAAVTSALSSSVKHSLVDGDCHCRTWST